MSMYESVFILDTGLEEGLQDKFVQKIESLITDNSGTILNNLRWGKKRLSYEIKKKQYGNYVCLEFEASGEVISQIEREYRLSEFVLRFLTMDIHKKVLTQRRKQDADYLKAPSVPVESEPEVQTEEK